MSDKKIKSLSWLDKVNTAAVLLITPEYDVIKRSRPAGYGSEATFSKPFPMPTFVHASNQLGYLNYVPNPEEVSDYIRGCSGRVGATTLWFKNYPKSLVTIDPKLAHLNKPVLIFWGEQDQLLLVNNAHRLSQRLSRSRLHIFKNCGHFSYQDQHEEFGKTVAEWVSADYKTL